MNPSTTPANLSTLSTRRKLLHVALGIVGFVALLLAVLIGVDRVMGHYNRNRHWAGRLGPEVYRAVRERSVQRNTDAHVIYLGDSVGLQMFWPGHEPVPTVRYLTTNQAVGVAGQFYLLRSATAHYPNLRKVFLLYTPRSWANRLAPPLAKDYFAEFFNSPDEIAQIFKLKRDPDLALSQIGRAVLPNLLAANSEASLALYSDDPTQLVAPPSLDARGKPPAADQTEPMLRIVSSLSKALFPSPLATTPQPSDRIDVSPLSAYFLDQIRSWCRVHHLQLRVIPCPCIETNPFPPGPSPYDAPLWYLPASYFKDSIHFVNPKVASVRAEFIQRYGLTND